MARIRKEALKSFFDRSKLRLDKCLAPGMECAAMAIRSHSLQNSQILDLLVRDGHVKALRKKIQTDAGPVIAFDDLGRNQATTFTGFCASHDHSIFQAIDTQAFRSEDSEHLFLVAYRAVSKELHALMEAVVKIQAGYEDRVRLGIDSGDVPTPVGLLAIEYVMRSYSVYTYKATFDRALVSKRYGELLHDVIHISHDEAGLAVCSFFSIDGLSNRGDYVCAALNVLPQNRHESVVVFSYLPSDQELVRPFLDRLLTSDGHCQKYLISRLILNNCENFVVSPSTYDRWSHEKKTAITDYFVKTIFEGKLEEENEYLYLF